MAIYWKLTDEKFRTRPGESNETLWGEGVTHEVSGDGDLCGPGWIHFYLSPELAVLLNPIHADFQHPALWEIEAEIGKSDGQMKAGAKKVTTLRQIVLPTATTEQRIKFAILCALKVYREESFAKWAAGWLSGADRSAAQALAARATAWAAYVARATVWAAEAARAAEAAAEAVEAAKAAAEAAWAAQAAAEAAAKAAKAAAFDLIEIAKEALQ